jgi:hypothetical protein
MSSHFTKRPTQNLGDSILNSSESLLSKMMSNRPPPHPKPRMLPPPHHFHQRARTALAAAEVKHVRNFFKHPTQNLGDSILNSSETPLSKTMSNSPPPTTPNHACDHLHTISTGMHRTCCCRSQTRSPFHQMSHPKPR